MLKVLTKALEALQWAKMMVKPLLPKCCWKQVIVVRKDDGEDPTKKVLLETLLV